MATKPVTTDFVGKYVELTPPAPSPDLFASPNGEDLFASMPGDLPAAGFDAFSAYPDSSGAFSVADPLASSSSFPIMPSSSFGPDPFLSPQSVEPLLRAPSPSRRPRSPAPNKSLDEMITDAVTDLNLDSAPRENGGTKSAPTLFDLLDSKDGAPPTKPPRSGVSGMGASSPALGQSEKKAPNVFDMLSSGSNAAVPIPSSSPTTKTAPALPPKPAALRPPGIAGRLQSVMDKLADKARALSPDKRGRSPVKTTETSKFPARAPSQMSEDSEVGSDVELGYDRVGGSGDDGFGSDGGYGSE